ncbi:hypothetical protein NOGI109294_06115 [Nocardiopsis gilva]
MSRSDGIDREDGPVPSRFTCIFTACEPMRFG